MDAHCSDYSTVYDHSCVNSICIFPFIVKRKILLAIIPNIPFFFCAWRSWSHYRGIYSFGIILVLLVSDTNYVIAYRSSQYLQSLLDHDLILPEASEPLDEVYNMYPATTLSASSDPNSESNPSSSESSISVSKTNPEHEPQHTLLLDPEAVPSILSIFKLESTTTSTDLLRAIAQARLRVASGRVDL